MRAADVGKGIRAWLVAALVAVVLVSGVVVLRRRPMPGHVVVRLPPDVALDVPRVTTDPQTAVKAARLDEAGNLSLDTDGRAFTLRLPETCPVHVPAARSSAPTTVIATPLLRIEGATSQVGYDTDVSLTAVRGCAEAEHGKVAWRQAEGLPLTKLAVMDGGGRFSARTLPRSAYFQGPPPPGIVAVSPRTQGRYVVEATLTGDAFPAVRRAVTVTSVARATGLSSLAVSQRVLLGGAGWHVTRAPRGSHAHVEPMGDVAAFTPDVSGRWLLADGAGASLGVQALTHDRTPLDCGRSECHAAIATAALGTPMSNALVKPGNVAGRFSPSSCLLECHVAGERGLHDGGFLDVMAALGTAPTAATTFDDLPHAVQRLGGVRCTSCHGPGAIPEASGRARVLRADVCATCHDAPPAYTHVEQWRHSAMSRSDRDARARHDSACARCHTTGGFLDATGIRKREDRSADPDDAVVGVACAACHAVHGAHQGEALVRDVHAPDRQLPPDPSLARTASRSVCVGCHSPGPDELVPSASSATLVEGWVRLPVSLGAEELRGASAHANIEGGCTGCHGARTGERASVDHSFRVDPAICGKCHAEPFLNEAAKTAASTSVRAAKLVGEARGSCKVTTPTPHASPESLPGCRLPAARARALYLATLVASDRGASAHGAAFARMLLDRAAVLLHPARSN